MNSYTDALESYLIAEEGFMDKVKSAGKVAVNALKKAIQWLMNKLRSLVTKIKNIRVVDKRDIENKISTIKDESQKKLDKANKDLVEARKESDENRQKYLDEASSKTISQTHARVKFYNCDTLYRTINGINSQIINIYKEIPRLRNFIKREDLDFQDYTKVKWLLGEMFVEGTGKSIIISSEVIEDLNEDINIMIEEFESENGRAYHNMLSVGVKTSIESCIKNISTILHEMQYIADNIGSRTFQSTTVMSTHNSKVDSRYPETFNRIVSGCNKSIASLTSVQSALSKILTHTECFVR